MNKEEQAEFDSSDGESESERTTIREFDYGDIPKYSTITIIASRRSGKSVLTRDILYHELIKKRKIKNIVIVSPTTMNGDYSFLADKYKFTEFNEHFLNAILDNQESLIREDPDGDHDLVMILDDIVKSTSQKTRDILSRLYTLSRHYRLYVILVSQSLKHETTPVIKMNSDLVVIFKTKNMNNKQEIMEHWLGFSSKEDRDKGIRVIDEIAQGYRSMIINNTVHSNDIQDIVSYHEVDVEHSVPKNFFMY